MSIEVQHVAKTFGDFTALHDLSLTIPDGRLVAILGPSGCGKTTLLRIIAGLEMPDPRPETDIRFDGVSVLNSPVNRRRVGFVFQHYALFRQMTVAENVAFGLRVKPRRERPSEAAIREKVQALLDLVQLSRLGARYPDQLSGGQRQRVALARALAVEPKLLLLDEPFGALDAQVRAELRRWLRHLHDTTGLTSLFVTHDQEEALEVADEILVMNRGHIEQQGSANDLFQHPKSEFVMNFLGEVNIFRGRFGHGEDVKMLVRPHDFAISSSPLADGLPAEVIRILTAGAMVKLELLDNNRQVIYVHLSHSEFAESPVSVGQHVYLTAKSSRLFRNGEDYAPEYQI